MKFKPGDRVLVAADDSVGVVARASYSYFLSEAVYTIEYLDGDIVCALEGDLEEAPEKETT